MKNYSRFLLNCKDRKIYFKGDCLNLLDLCEAMCCREWEIDITEKEFRTNLYKVKSICSLDNKDCNNRRLNCINRKYVLKKRENGSCIYLNSYNKCSIYEHRPEVCRYFNCKGGWKISFAAPLTTRKGSINKTKNIINIFKDDMKFILNPLMELKTAFYSKRNKKITFVVKHISKCSLTANKYNFYSHKMDDNSLLYLIKLFNRRNTLKKVLENLNKKYNFNISKEDFNKIIDFLYKENIIIQHN